MRTILFSFLISICLFSCNADKCECSATISIQEIDSLVTLQSLVYEDYWKVVYGEEIIKGTNKEMIRLESSFFLVPYSKIYILKKVYAKPILITKLVYSEPKVKLRMYTIISEKEKELSSKDWQEIKTAIDQNCFWNSSPSVTSYSDGIPYILEVNSTKENNCTNRKYHVARRTYIHSEKSSLDPIFELITKHESISDIDSLNRAYVDKVQSKK